MVKICKQID